MIVTLLLVIVTIVLVTVLYESATKKIEASMLIDEPIIGSGEVNQLLTEEVSSGENLLENEKQQSSSEESTVKNLSSNTPYYIKVNNSQNVVTIYAKDANGEYKIPYKAMICSVGEATPAAGNAYKITTYKNRWNALQGNVYGQYATQIVGNILFHSVPYTAKSNSALEYWEYDKLGTDASLGCVRLTVEDAKWIYDNIEAGTIVEFYEDSNPGPLRKTKCTKDFR